MTSLPAPGAAAQITTFLQQHPWWSAFWDKTPWRLARRRGRPRLGPLRRKRQRRRGAQLHDSPFV